MSVCVLRANKTKMVMLLRSKGYKPTIKKSKYEKAYRSRSYWLTWLQSDGLYTALLTTAAGRSFLKVSHDGEDKFIPVPLAELERYEMKEEISK